jgi:isopentenyl-diphosphate delta-isomerase
VTAPDLVTEPELVVLAGEDGSPIGSAWKSEVHTDATPLHFAFSCYVLGPDGRMLISRRALS